MRTIFPTLALLLFPINLFAQVSEDEITSSTKVLNVDVSTFDPFVSIVDGKPTGFDIEFLEIIVGKLGYRCDYRIVQFENIFDGLKNESADVSIGGISITAERESSIDFTQPYFLTGKQFLVMNDADANSVFRYFVSLFTNTNVPKIIFIFFCFVILTANIIWVVERNDNPTIEKTYLKGVFDTTYFVVTTMATVGYGDISPKKRSTRGIVMLVMLSGIALFSWSISEFQGEIVKQKLEAGISGKEDLKGQRVAVVKGTTSEESVADEGYDLVKVDDIKDAYFALYTEDVKAVVSDSAILNHYAITKGKGKVKVVGDMFKKGFYGIALPEGSPLLEDFNMAILDFAFDENDREEYLNLVRKYSLVSEN